MPIIFYSVLWDGVWWPNAVGFSRSCGPFRVEHLNTQNRFPIKMPLLVVPGKKCVFQVWDTFFYAPEVCIQCHYPRLWVNVHILSCIIALNTVSVVRYHCVYDVISKWRSNCCSYGKHTGNTMFVNALWKHRGVVVDIAYEYIDEAHFRFTLPFPFARAQWGGADFQGEDSVSGVIV